MGLDWVLKSKIIAGKEEEHAEVRKKRLEARDKYYEQDALGADKLVLSELKETLDRLEDKENELEINPFAVLDCPRVGIDPEATAYVVKQYSEYGRPEFLERYPTLESWLKANHGKYVPELAKNKDGLGKITGIVTGPESFRGKVIGYAEKIIGQKLAEQAYQDMDPEEMESYANALEQKVQDWRDENETAIDYYMDKIGGCVNDGPYEDPEMRDLLDSTWDCENAVTWLRFWAKHGFSMHAWY
jgi:hypothetical protein